MFLAYTWQQLELMQSGSYYCSFIEKIYESLLFFIDDIFHDLDNRGLVHLSVQHLKGDPIYYKSSEELLEVFMNFHLETFFNCHELLDAVIKDIIKQIEKYRQDDGTYRVDPGCYIYTLTKP